MRVVHVLRKPCSEPTVTANVLRHGTGALNVDAARIPSPEYQDIKVTQTVGGPSALAFRHRVGNRQFVPSSNGRWPANMVLDVGVALPEFADAARYFFRTERS